MNHPHLSRAFIILLCILVAVTFFVGALRTFSPARAASVLNDQASNTGLSSVGKEAALAPTSTASTPLPVATISPAPTSPLSTSTGAVVSGSTSVPTPGVTPSLIPTVTPSPIPLARQYYSTDMSGIVALTILLVMVILVGVAWGARAAPKKKATK